MPEAIRKSIELPTVDHRRPSFKAEIERLNDDIKKVLKAEDADLFLFPATGTGGWEAAIANTLRAGDKILACRHGVFSNKWIEMCRGFGLDVQVIECDWRGPAQPALIQQALEADTKGEIRAVLATHNETATGVKSDLCAIRRAIDAANHDALFFVDGVSSIASMDFRMTEWGIDVAVTGSQKGFMLPAGVAIVAVRERALAASKTANLPKFFFDFGQMTTTIASGGYPYTPPTQLLAGLQLACDMLLEEGLEAVFDRHFYIAEGVRRAVKAWGMEICANSHCCESDTVTTVILPEGCDGAALTGHVYERYQMSFGVGLGQFAGKAFRIGHLGLLSESQMLCGLATIEMAMKDLDFPIELGSGVAAAQAWYCREMSLSQSAKEVA